MYMCLLEIASKGLIFIVLEVLQIFSSLKLNSQEELLDLHALDNFLIYFCNIFAFFRRCHNIGSL